LPAAVTIVLAIGVSRMAREERYPEAAGGGDAGQHDRDLLGQDGDTGPRPDDGTGSVCRGDIFFATTTGYETNAADEGNDAGEVNEWPALLECLRAGVLCNESRLTRHEGKLHTHGDPTELAMLVAGKKAGSGMRIRTAIRRGWTPFLSIPLICSGPRCQLTPAQNG
jgi:Ca2+-transporting ATPase